ncbi:hypothetical protein T492DRAFT_835618 [Pavlovales sp. CCMP2436]|nr:hypothetical protein T492DRAFT_835618 [Pavlovales sp. CCMP2436]
MCGIECQPNAPPPLPPFLISLSSCEAPNNITSDFAGLLYLEPKPADSALLPPVRPPGRSSLAVVAPMPEEPEAWHLRSQSIAVVAVTPISEDHMLLRGCQLRNTRELLLLRGGEKGAKVYGLVVTAGVQTKIQFAQPVLIPQLAKRATRLGRCLSTALKWLSPVLRLCGGGAGAAGKANVAAEKVSAMTSRVNLDILGICLLLAAITFLGVFLHFDLCNGELAAGHWLWYLSVNHPTDDYGRGLAADVIGERLDNADGSDLCEGGPQLFGTYFLLSYNLIPVSLYVSISMVYLTLSLMMASDLGMYDPSQDQPAVVRTMSLSDELGRISHVLSDKSAYSLTTPAYALRDFSETKSHMPHPQAL